jgi:hypothetical protein
MSSGLVGCGAESHAQFAGMNTTGHYSRGEVFPQMATACPASITTSVSLQHHVNTVYLL